LKIRHILLILLALLTIGFLQPLVSFLGGLTLLLGIGTLVFRDLPPKNQDALERHLLGLLRRARGSVQQPAEAQPNAFQRLPATRTTTESAEVAEKPRRSRVRAESPAIAPQSAAPLAPGATISSKASDD